MRVLASKTVLGLAALGLTMLLPLQSAQAEAPAEAQAQKSGPLLAAIQTYQSASQEGRPSAAQALRRALSKDTTAPAILQAKANFLLGDFAILDGRKDLALKQANQGLKLLEGRDPNDAPDVRALGARVKAQALAAKEERLAAFKVILEARLAYGHYKPKFDRNWDPVWDELFLWQTVTQDNLRGEERAQAVALLAAHQTELYQILKADGPCAFQNVPVKILNQDTNLPGFPIVPLFAGQTGGVLMRLSFTSEGRVTRAMASAFTSAEDFAIMTERAAANWTATGLGLDQPNCLSERPALVVFKYS